MDETNGGGASTGCNIYALFAVNSPIIRMVSSCIVAVSNRVLILAVLF